MNDAETRALQEVASQLERIERNPLGFGWKSVPIGKELGPLFLNTPRSPLPGPLRLVDVRPNSNGWDVILKGQWTAKVTLNDDFTLRAVSRERQ
jgi:hypothetical protein